MSKAIYALRVTTVQLVHHHLNLALLEHIMQILESTMWPNAQHVLVDSCVIN